jgi:phosphoenolpyruvate carboxylase
MTIKTQPKTAFGKTLHYVTDPTLAAALTSLTEYYKSLYNTVTELEDNDLKPVLTQYPSTINRKRRSTFVRKCKSVPTKVC